MSRLSDIQDKIFIEIGQPSTNSNITTTQLNLGINTGYRVVYMANNWKWLMTDDATHKLPYTTTSTGTSTGTNLYATSRTNMYAGQILVVGSNTYEYVVVNSAAASPVTLISPGLDGSYTSGTAYIGGASIQKPTDFMKLDSIILKDDNDSTTNFSYTKLERTTEQQNEEINSGIITLGMPEYFMERENDFMFNCGADNDGYRIALRYYKKPSDITTDINPLFSVIWDDILVWFGIAWFYNRIGDASKASFFGQIFNRELTRMLEKENTTYDDRPRFSLKRDKRM